MGRAFLVVGAEDTGTRAVTRVLIAAGCAGDASHFQPFDNGIPRGHDRIVWRRSVPHAGQWPAVSHLLILVRNAGYQPHVIVTMRDWSATAVAQVSATHVKTKEQALENLQRAYRCIFRDLGSVDYTIVNYESFGTSQMAIDLFLQRLGLSAPQREPFYDGNKRWFP